MVTLITYPLQVPDAPLALMEVGDFQATLLRKYLGDAPLTLAAEEEESVTEEPLPEGPVIPWSCDRSTSGEDMRELDALAIYTKVSKNARRILDQLIDAYREYGDDVPLTGQGIAAKLGLAPAQLRGTLASIEMRSRAVCRYNPVFVDSGPDEGFYQLSNNATEAFDWARNMYEATQQGAQDKIDELNTQLDRGFTIYSPD